MSSREQAASLLERLPEYKLGYVLAYLQGLTADEEADDAFCQHLVEDYENDPDPRKDDVFPLDECKQEWGLA